jgi:hypothetical protein
MPQWQVYTADNPAGEVFDDGLPALPGEDGFSTEAVAARAGSNGTFNYIGPSPRLEE